MHYEIHNKKLPIPSFFQVYNFGGGRGDKDREIVYSEFTKDTPALINYYYINNEYPHEFQYKIFDDLSGYDTVGDLYTFVEQLRLMQPRQQDVFVMETKILQHWFILRYITKRASRDSVNTLLVDLMLMVVKEKKIQII